MRHKILIVDDDEGIQLIVKNAFGDSYHVLSASDGLAAVEIIRKESPTLVFLDLNMPGVSGMKVLKMLKDSGLSPVIWMLTGEEDLETALETLKMGASGYLTKPFDIQKIRDVALDAIAVRERSARYDGNDDRPWHLKKKRK